VNEGPFEHRQVSEDLALLTVGQVRAR
jgi:hypothetical protein